MGMGDSYAQALQARRGKGVDPKLPEIGQINASHGGIDSRLGVDGAASAQGEAPGGQGSVSSTAFDWRSPDHKDQHTSPVNENNPAAPPASWRSPDHVDEHTRPVGESATAAPLPASQSAGVGGGDLGGDIKAYVGGHASQNEYEQLKGMKPRSLGERAKMDVLKSQYEPSGSGKNG